MALVLTFYGYMKENEMHFQRTHTHTHTKGGREKKTGFKYNKDLL